MRQEQLWGAVGPFDPVEAVGAVVAAVAAVGVETAAARQAALVEAVRCPTHQLQQWRQLQ